MKYSFANTAALAATLLSVPAVAQLPPINQNVYCDWGQHDLLPTESTRESDEGFIERTPQQLMGGTQITGNLILDWRISPSDYNRALFADSSADMVTPSILLLEGGVSIHPDALGETPLPSPHASAPPNERLDARPHCSIGIYDWNEEFRYPLEYTFNTRARLLRDGFRIQFDRSVVTLNPSTRDSSKIDYTFLGTTPHVVRYQGRSLNVEFDVRLSCTVSARQNWTIHYLDQFLGPNVRLTGGLKPAPGCREI